MQFQGYEVALLLQRHGEEIYNHCVTADPVEIMSDRWPALRDVFSYRSLVHAISGATGSSIAITTFYPLDIARTKAQVDDGKNSLHTPALLKEISDEEGIEGLYRGWFPVVTSVCCSNFVYFYTFNTLKAVVYGPDVKGYPFKDLVLAYIAGCVNVVLTTPLWVANTRLKLQVASPRSPQHQLKCPSKATQSTYQGMIDCLMKIYYTEGVEALWSGTVPSLVLATNPAIQFAVYEALKRFATRRGRTEVSGLTYFLIGAIAKMVATVITYPLQVIQSRLRAGRDKSKHGLKGMYHTLMNLQKHHGTAALYKGLETKLAQTVFNGRSNVPYL